MSQKEEDYFWSTLHGLLPNGQLFQWSDRVEVERLTTSSWTALFQTHLLNWKCYSTENLKMSERFGWIWTSSTLSPHLESNSLHWAHVPCHRVYWFEEDQLRTRIVTLILRVFRHQLLEVGWVVMAIDTFLSAGPLDAFDDGSVVACVGVDQTVWHPRAESWDESVVGVEARQEEDGSVFVVEASTLSFEQLLVETVAGDITRPCAGYAVLLGELAAWKSTSRLKLKRLRVYKKVYFWTKTVPKRAHIKRWQEYI